MPPTWNLTIIKDGVTVKSVTGLTTKPTVTADAAMWIDNSGDEHTYPIGPGYEAIVHPN